MWLLKISLLQALAIPNSPFPQRYSMVPTTELSFYPIKYFFMKNLSSARCVPQSWNRLHPITARWDISMGANYWFGDSKLSLEVGHRSEHGFGKYDFGTESMDFILLSFEIPLE
jgi:hypothetical protein